jgi:cytochrome P450
MTAGGGTTVYALSHAVYYVLSHPQVLLRLKEELKESEPYIKKKDWRYIENLPYLVNPQSYNHRDYLTLYRGV